MDKDNVIKVFADLKWFDPTKEEFRVDSGMTGVMEQAFTTLVSLQDEAIRKGLMELGWTPPTKATLYTIPPLEWVKQGKRLYVDTPVGEYSVMFAYISKDEKDVFKWGYWTLGGGKWENPCTSIEDGKAQAEKHYREQLGKCLKVWNG